VVYDLMVEEVVEAALYLLSVGQGQTEEAAVEAVEEEQLQRAAPSLSEMDLLEVVEEEEGLGSLSLLSELIAAMNGCHAPKFRSSFCGRNLLTSQFLLISWFLERRRSPANDWRGPLSS
jgi:hypothetical protein